MLTGLGASDTGRVCSVSDVGVNINDTVLAYWEKWW